MEKWAKQTQRDMDYIKMAVQRGAAVPEIIWESRHIEVRILENGIKQYIGL